MSCGNHFPGIIQFLGPILGLGSKARILCSCFNLEGVSYPQSGSHGKKMVSLSERGGNWNKVPATLLVGLWGQDNSSSDNMGKEAVSVSPGNKFVWTGSVMGTG